MLLKSGRKPFNTVARAVPQHTEMLVLILPSGQGVNQRLKRLCALGTNLHLSDNRCPYGSEYSSDNWVPFERELQTSIPEVPQEQD